ncbi:MAG TPA: hypothetical protein VNF47_19550 [Streptosporangiaceae bacterium]|nr:hypothetical protein [Streptosporangiaceae bacterium]
MLWPDGISPGEGIALDWINEKVVLGVSTRSLVPAIFDAYVRVFHPAYQVNQRTGEGRTVRWKEVADWSGQEFSPSVSFSVIAGPTLGTESFPFGEPDQGRLDADTCTALKEILRLHTSSNAQCFFAFWDGYGIQDSIPFIKRGTLDGDSFLLVAGSIDLACDFPVGPTLWWSVDRAWLVVTDIDNDSTVVGCSSAAAAALFADPRLETLELAPQS